MEPTTGLEPVNLFLTKEVLYQLSYVGSIRGVRDDRTRRTDATGHTLTPAVLDN